MNYEKVSIYTTCVFCIKDNIAIFMHQLLLIISIVQKQALTLTIMIIINQVDCRCYASAQACT